MGTYRDEVNSKTLEKINDFTVDMPIFVRRFANEYLVTKNKAPRTVLGYVGDIKVFFEYLEKTQGIPVSAGRFPPFRASLNRPIQVNLKKPLHLVLQLLK